MLLRGQVPERRLAGAEPAPERERDASRPGPLAASELGAAHVGGVAAAEALHAARQVVRRVVSVRVHPGDVLAARGPEADVECDRRAALRVVEDPDPLVLLGQPLELGDRVVVRAAVDEQELDLAVEALSEHGARGGLYVGRLVQHRREDAYVHALPLPVSVRRPRSPRARPARPRRG